ncbi:MAG TPA: cellulase family glycosylhydrolase [Anaerolineales bacterium]|nr:cellulase family glycosylhydrolase [Anaerolineales bacterium]
MKITKKVACFLVLILLLVGIFLPPRPVQAAAGFHVSGRNLLDASGNNFIMRGISHPHVWYTSQTSSFANIKAAGANTVRVVLGGGRWGPSSASDVANVIQLCKTNKLICVLENHDTTGYGEDGAATSLAQAVNYWKSIQSVLIGQEAYVLINIGNEPYGNNNASAWVESTRNAIITMRDAGFDHTLIVDAPNWGQDWQFVMRDNAASIFNSDADRNTIFSIHMYGVFDTAAEVQSYVSSFVTAGLPLVIGEFGWNHSDGNPDEDAIVATAQANGIGYIGWSWSGNGGGVEYLDMVTSFNPDQRTDWGKRIITGSNGLQETSVQASVYDEGTPTFTPTGPTPTITLTPSGALKVQLVAAGTDNTQQTAFHYRLQNNGVGAASNISVRLYFTTDGSNAASSYVLEKYYDQSGAATVSGPTQALGSTYYFTVNYGTASLPAGGTWDYHTAIHLNNWASTYNATNDWWHGTSTLPANYTDWTAIPAYVSGARVWGNEPIGGPTNTPTRTPTRTFTPTLTPTGATNTPTRTPTPTATFCPQATAEPLWVEPVTSPTDQTSQVITVRIGNSDSVTVAHEFGSTTVTGNFSTSNPALVTVPLQVNATHHLRVSVHIKPMIGPGGCSYGNYTLSTGNDRYGSPLTIVQTDSTITPTPTTLRVQYRAADTNAGDNQIKPHFNIVNAGASSVLLNELKIRYWFTREGTANQNFWCDWSAIAGSCSSLSGTFVQVSPARTGANFYLEISFTPAAGSIAAGGQSGEIQARFAKSDWSNYTETGDYSFDPTKLSFADWDHVTLYRNGVLVWGTEP